MFKFSQHIKANSQALIPAAIRQFRFFVELPPLPQEINSIYILLSILTSYIQKPNTEQVISKLREQYAHSNDIGFRRTIDLIQKLVQNDPPKSLWELTSDLNEFYGAYYRYAKKMLPNFSEKDNNNFSNILQKKKPQNVKDPRLISFDLSDPIAVNMLQNYYESFKSFPFLHCDCKNPAVYFCNVCNFGISCEDCFEEEEEYECPKCHSKIKRNKIIKFE